MGFRGVDRVWGDLDEFGGFSGELAVFGRVWTRFGGVGSGEHVWNGGRGASWNASFTGVNFGEFEISKLLW